VALAAEGERSGARVYTNADLPSIEGSEPAAAAATIAFDETSWNLVRDFIDREYAKIEAERQADLERRRVEQEEQQPPAGYGVPYLGLDYYGYGYGYGSGYHDYGPGREGGCSRRLAAPHLERPVFPPHKGSDAFPDAKPRRPRGVPHGRRTHKQAH
jgi:hypothetical protein